MMLKKSYIYLILTVVALLAAACSKAPELTEPSVPTPDMTNVIKFDMLETKVTNDDITKEEFIIYDYVDGFLYIDGSLYTLKYSDSEGAWRFFDSSGNAVDFYWTESGTHEFFAYNKVDYYWSDALYPSYKVSLNFDYSEKCLIPTSYIRLLYPTSSPDARGLYQDLIYATTTRNVSEDGYGPVEIRFNHMFASVKFTFQNNSLTDKTISNLSITNLYHSTGFGTRLYFDGSQTLDFESDGTYEFPISATVRNGEAWDAFGTIIVLPQALGGLTEKVVWHEGGVEKRLYIYNDLGTSYWYAGKLYHYVITLDPTELILEPTVTIEHTEDAGGDKSSVVIVNLNAPDEELPRITDLDITVTDPESNVIKTYEAATVVSNEIRLECGELLTPGTYTVSVYYSVAYHDELKRQSVSKTAVSEDTAVQPAVGYYVNSDGTFSETFVSGESIAKIFWMGDPTEKDPQLKADYPDCNRGLAYEVDENGELRLIANASTWGSFHYSTAGLDHDTLQPFININLVHGYTNTKFLKNNGYNKGVIAGFDFSGKYDGTSTWYLPSAKEFTLVFNDTNAYNKLQSGLSIYGYGAFISTMYQSGYYIYPMYAGKDGSFNNVGTSSNQRHYFRILAF